MVKLMGGMFNELDRAAEPVTPHAFVQIFRTLYPQFAQRGQSGMFMQQDADECLTTFLQLVDSKLPAKYGTDANSKENAMTQMFGFEIEKRYAFLKSIYPSMLHSCGLSFNNIKIISQDTRASKRRRRLK